LFDKIPPSANRLFDPVQVEARGDDTADDEDDQAPAEEGHEQACVDRRSLGQCRHLAEEKGIVSSRTANMARARGRSAPVCRSPQEPGAAAVARTDVPRLHTHSAWHRARGVL
jgi:hypothetical protein